jgi:hypothetical protein
MLQSEGTERGISKHDVELSHTPNHGGFISSVPCASGDHEASFHIINIWPIEDTNTFLAISKEKSPGLYR